MTNDQCAFVIRNLPFVIEMRFLQRYPHFLEVAYDATHKVLGPLRRWLKPGTAVEPIFTKLEAVSKGAVFDCRMCGQCVLHSTGMTCPMTCPKNLRNGPCGGVRPDGHCEIIPEMKCVWVEAWERSKHMPIHGQEILHVTPPLNRSLQGASAWINDFTGVSTKAPAGWKDD
ncbi:MAG TPA: methylenetetrahydrofolate reductase C-terminal domain-containing protein [Anaerolineales bacterium]|nr:methylenetetrahydrofolate reductase C-terminal domain-containing protein [Anaerolineales bacterium]